MIDKGLEHKKTEKRCIIDTVRQKRTGRKRNYNVCHFKSCGRVFFGVFTFYSSASDWGNIFREQKKKPQITPGIVNLPFSVIAPLEIMRRERKRSELKTAYQTLCRKIIAHCHFIIFCTFFLVCEDDGIQMKVSSTFTFFCPFNFILAFKWLNYSILSISGRQLF